jgi:putative heme-binding domain-containing protein
MAILGFVAHPEHSLHALIGTSRPSMKPYRTVSAVLLALCVCHALPQAWSDPQPNQSPTQREYLNFALRREGDGERGRALFADEQRLACSKCHTVDGSAAKAGPDLFAIGDKFGRREIIDAVLTPSATIAVGYSTTIIQTRSGEEISGIIKQATAEWIELMSADARRVRIPTVQIMEWRTSEISLMPEGLQNSLTVQEFADLIEYLVSLKQPESAATLAHGMPSQIPALAHGIELEPFIKDDLAFEHPVWIGPIKGQSNAFLVVEHESGRIWRLDKRTGGEVKQLFVDLGAYQKGTRGLLGMVLHPQFQANHRYFYVKHLVDDHGQFSTVVAERRARPDLQEDSGLESRVILRWDEATNVHYGGGLAFGADGYLYVGTGDSGPQEDPQGHAQDPGLLLGKMLRIDVDHHDGPRPYSIPHDNPFIGRSGFRPEIWAWGFREPWRFSFDPVTGDLWVGDVGQDRYEEVDIVRRGENYGWNVFEGLEPFSNRFRREGQLYVPPVFAYGRKFGVSVTGGYVCRTTGAGSFQGVYVFGDYESRRLFGLKQQNRVLQTVRQIGTAPQRVVSFGRDREGNLLLVGYEGMIYRVNFNGAVFE